MDKELLQALDEYRFTVHHVLATFADTIYFTGKNSEEFRAFRKADKNLHDLIDKARAASVPVAVPAPAPAAA